MNAREIEELLSPLIESDGAEIVDVQWRREGGPMVLRLFLDKPAGISLDDCAYFSDRVGAFLDEKDVITQRYVLEISSPGLDRVIKKGKDFARYSGEPVKLRLKAPDNGQRAFRGILRGLEGDEILVEVAGALKKFPRGNVDEVRLDDAAAAEAESGKE